MYKLAIIPSLVVLYTLFSFGYKSKFTKKPVIGIVTTPSDFTELYDPNEYSYIKNSYPEFLDEGEAASVVIPWDSTEEDLMLLLNSVNGVVFTGGNSALAIEDPETGKLVLSPFTLRAKQIVDYAIDQHKQGNVFPVLGVCQGPQVVSMAISEDPYLIDGYDHKKAYDYLMFEKAGRESRLFSHYPSSLFEFLEENKASYFEHKLGISPESLKKNAKLQEFFNIIALAKDTNGKVFIAALEGKELPFYLVQYHPENTLQDFKEKGKLDRSKDNFKAIYHIAQFFVDEARKNNHVFPEDNERLKKFRVENGKRVFINEQWFDLYFYKTWDVNPEETNYQLEGLLDN